MATLKFQRQDGTWEEVSAAKLETARKINGVLFDGTEDITVPSGTTINVDNSTVELITGDILQVKDAGITDNKIGDRTLVSATSTDSENVSASKLTVILQNLSNRIKSLLDRFNISTGHKHDGTDSAKISHVNLTNYDDDSNHLHLNDSQKNQGGLATGVSTSSPISSKDLSTLNKVANVVDSISKVYIEDFVSTTKTLNVVDNMDARLGTLTSLTISISITKFVCSVSFSSGTTATNISFPSSTIKWFGIDCGTGTFVPRASKRYNLVIWEDGININSIVNAV